MSFRAVYLEASHWVLEKRTPPGFIVDEGVLISAARYLLAEFPLFLNTVGILEKTNSVFCYHQRVPFLENLYARSYSLKPKEGQGFLLAPSSQHYSPIDGYAEIPRGAPTPRAS